MSEELEWTNEQKAEHFRKEIHDRFVEENKYHQQFYCEDLEHAKKRYPREFEHNKEHFPDVEDSIFWQTYKDTEINIKGNSVDIILPISRYAITTEFLDMFAGTTMAWSLPFIESKIIDGEARMCIHILLTDYWTDEKERQWKQEKQCKEAYLFKRLSRIM